MSIRQVFEQSIEIRAAATLVERCIVDRTLMHKWLNPLLRCEPEGEWDTAVGSRSLFIIKIPVLQPTLESVVLDRQPGLIVWGFDGYFKGCDRWECQPQIQGTLLINRFEFQIPNPLIRFGFNRFAAAWTQKDMKSQLRRLKRVAEQLSQEIGKV